MHLIHKWIEDESWPDPQMADPGYRFRHDIVGHRTCETCGRGQTLHLGMIGSPADPIQGEEWRNDG